MADFVKVSARRVFIYERRRSEEEIQFFKGSSRGFVAAQTVEYRGWYGREWSMADEGHHMEDDGAAVRKGSDDRGPDHNRQLALGVRSFRRVMINFTKL